MYEWTLTGASQPVTVDGHLGTLPTVTRGETITLEAAVTPGDSAVYDALTAWLDYAYMAAVDVAQGREPFYQERVPSEAAVDSQMVSVEPGDDVRGARPVWGLIIDGEDLTERLAGRARVDLEIAVLAPLGDYADRAAVQAALEVSA